MCKNAKSRTLYNDNFLQYVTRKKLRKVTNCKASYIRFLKKTGFLLKKTGFKIKLFIDNFAEKGSIINTPK